MTKTAHQQGVALVIVLWILALLTVIANNLVFTARTELLAMSNAGLALRARMAADAGLHVAIHALTIGIPTTTAESDERLRADGSSRRWQFDDFTIEVTASDESGKVDLNNAQPDLINALFRAAGASAEVADACTDAVLDWRDADDLRRLHGAEREHYEQAGRMGQIANGNFTVIEELQSVLGVSQDVFRRAIPMATVHSGLAGINPRFADAALLRALPGASQEMVEQFVAERELARSNTLTAPVFPAATNLQAVGPPRAINIRSVAVFGDNYRLSREAVVQITGLADTPYRILRIGNSQPPALSQPNVLEKS